MAETGKEPLIVLGRGSGLSAAAQAQHHPELVFRRGYEKPVQPVSLHTMILIQPNVSTKIAVLIGALIQTSAGKRSLTDQCGSVC